MATKAQLEAELADLKMQLAESKARSEEATLAQEATPEPSEEEPDPEHPAFNWETQITDVLQDVDDLSHKKPMLLILGAFALGYLISRSR